MIETVYYKITDAQGRSCDGGDHQWSLPRDGHPGEWHEIPRDVPLRICSTGFHVTTDPREWWKPGRLVFRVEVDGERTEPRSDKIAFRRVRLVERVTAAAMLAQSGVTLVRGALRDEHVFGDGSGYGYGYGDGSGCGYGDGSGYGYGYGDGYGYGYGDGYGCGYGENIASASIVCT